MVENTKTTDFLLPILDIKYSDLEAAGFENAYIGHQQELDETGNNLYLKFKNKVSPTRAYSLNSNKFSHTLDEDLVAVYTLTNEEKDKIVAPFLEGKYSKLDEDYVKKNYAPKVIINGREYRDYCYDIITRSTDLREYWEDRLNVSLGDDAEVWSKPILENEILEVGL